MTEPQPDPRRPRESLEEWRARIDRESAERVRIARPSEALPLWAQLPEEWEA
jgi:hypothetical protein